MKHTNTTMEKSFIFESPTKGGNTVSVAKKVLSPMAPQAAFATGYSMNTIIDKRLIPQI